MTDGMQRLAERASRIDAPAGACYADGARARKEDPLKITLPSVSSGTSRTSGTYIGVLLQLEHNEVDRLQIIVDMIRRFGYSIEQVEDMLNDTMCPHCGMSTYLHKYHNDGNCF